MWSKPHGRTRWQISTALPDIEAAKLGALAEFPHDPLGKQLLGDPDLPDRR